MFAGEYIDYKATETATADVGKDPKLPFTFPATATAGGATGNNGTDKTLDIKVKG